MLETLYQLCHSGRNRGRFKQWVKRGSGPTRLAALSVSMPTVILDEVNGSTGMAYFRVEPTMSKTSMQGTGNLANLTAVVASTPSGVIGLNGTMPWKLSSDLRRFKEMTMGGTLVMGRITYDSIGKPLPGRETIVLSRSPRPADLSAAVHWATDREEAMTIANRLDRPTFIVGGAEIYGLFFAQCDEIWLTRVWSDVEGDTRIEIPLENFDLVETSRHPQTARDTAPTEFQRWRRKNSVPKF